MDDAGAERPRRTILLLEDEMLPALIVEGILSDAGYDVVGPVPNVEEALALLRGARVDAALLDLNIQGTFSYDVGERCEELGIPWGVTTGYEAQSQQLSARDIPVLMKPFTDEQLLAMVADLLDR
ncbi:response regulator [Novosphingobium sp. JCM 18896]|uniref:response regulator n=1 Tax=Novosphingobium sp. JCM 18896 TaxID=2989731 RepID=UPI0022238B6E|nr:response regulator [Novosphingobium sp. JCM 18896]MCW1430797.1 response regulator [Novosphingobium sp. JCM 18896]